MTSAEYALSCVGKSRYDLGLNKSGEWFEEVKNKKENIDL